MNDASTVRALLVVTLGLSLLAVGCRTAAATQPTPQLHEPVHSVYWQRLSEPTKARLRTVLTAEQADDFDQIVAAACKTNPIAQCVCCAPSTLAACNPNNWDCCASVVFDPGDGGQCAFAPNGACQCQSPP